MPLDVLRDVIYWRDEQHSRVDTRAWIRQQWWAMEWEDSRMSQHDTTKLEWATRTTNSWLTSSGWNFHNSGILWHQEINNHEFIMTNEIFIEFAMVLAHNKKQIVVMSNSIPFFHHNNWNLTDVDKNILHVSIWVSIEIKTTTSTRPPTHIRQLDSKCV